MSQFSVADAGSFMFAALKFPGCQMCLQFRLLCFHQSITVLELLIELLALNVDNAVYSRYKVSMLYCGSGVVLGYRKFIAPKLDFHLVALRGTATLHCSIEGETLHISVVTVQVM